MDKVDLERIRKEAFSLLENKSLERSGLEKQYNYLFSVSKTLFEMILQPKFQTEILEMMLEKISKIQQETSTQEKESESIGQELYDIYVKPSLDLDG